jgi:hypothetical protein
MGVMEGKEGGRVRLSPCALEVNLADQCQGLPTALDRVDLTTLATDA